jgi:hypothetical protein
MFLKRPQYLTLLVLVFLSATAWAKPKVDLYHEVFQYG